MPDHPCFKIIMVGCGQMGQAMLRGWVDAGVISACDIVAPNLRTLPFQVPSLTIHRNTDDLPHDADMIIYAVKPQVLPSITSEYRHIVADNIVVISIAAGIPTSLYQTTYGIKSQIVRTMPNTPAAVRQGVTALYATDAVTNNNRHAAETLMQSLGESVWCNTEDQINDITALSGSGPAYVFYMVEAMSKAAEDLGLPEKDAMKLARQTVIGAATMLKESPDISASTLRENVTSPNGTTAAGLSVLMDHSNGLSDIMKKTLKAAADRSRQLSE